MGRTVAVSEYVGSFRAPVRNLHWRKTTKTVELELEGPWNGKEMVPVELKLDRKSAAEGAPGRALPLRIFKHEGGRT